MFGCGKKKERNSTSCNLVFEKGGKHWFPYNQIPSIGTELLIGENTIKYQSELKGRYLVTKIEYDISTTEQWTERTNWIFIYVKKVGN